MDYEIPSSVDVGQVLEKNKTKKTPKTKPPKPQNHLPNKQMSQPCNVSQTLQQWRGVSGLHF